MSTREIRRLQRQKLEAQAQETVEGSEDEIEEPVKQNKFNAFSFLGEEEEEEESEPEEQIQSKDERNDSTDHTVEIDSKPAAKSSMKKNKKKKSKKAKTQQEVPETNSDDELDRILAEVKSRDFKATKSPETNEDEQELDGIDFEEEYNEIEEPMPNYDPNFKNFTTERLKQSLSLLSIGSIKNLDSDEELKGLFGNLSLETIEDANATTSLGISPDVLKQFKRLARLTKGWGGKDKRSTPGTTRKLLLTRIKDDYLPTTQKPMLMEELKDSEILDIFDYKEDVAEVPELELKIRKEKKLGVKYFAFKKNFTVHERVSNTQFYASVVISPDHDALIALLRNYPYHAETLLQVSMVLLRQGSDKSTSNALVEKCLFVFDRCFHKFFHDLLSEAANGLIRLPYESFMNRQFYLCIFRYIINLGERATFFTSLSFCKFLLSVSPTEDPLGVRYFIDFYAIMSGEYKYLTQLANSPLVTCYTKWYTPGIAFSTVLAYLHLNDKENAKKLLIRAFSSHPYTALKMAQEIALAGNIPLRESDIEVDEETVLANETYMIRAKELWKGEDKLKFLNDELLGLFVNFKASKDSKPTTGIASKILSFFSKPKMETPSKEIPFNLLRFAILSGESKIMAKVPQSVWERDDVYEFDPLPPKNNTLGYSATGGVEGSKIIDTALDYVDQNVLASIIQNRTQDDEFEEMVRRVQQQQLEEQIEQEQ